MNLPTISLRQEALSHFEDAIQKEWIITNGLGGYASSTVLGINTRKYHGLLVAAFHPPRDRRVSLSKLDEEIVIGDKIYPIGANEFRDRIFPQGHDFLKEFSIAPFPRQVYKVGDVEVRKTVLMPHGKNAVTVVYRVVNKGSSDTKVRVFPMINARHFHSVVDRWKTPVEFDQKPDDRNVEISSQVPRSTLIVAITGGHYFPHEGWIERMYYREEARRGESCLDDCYRPGCFEDVVKANRSENFAVVAVADEEKDNARKTLAESPLAMSDVEALCEKECRRHEDSLTRFYESHEGVPSSDWLNWLVLATDRFIVKGISERIIAVIAGYHWFEAWGRDTFVSLPGLMLVTERFEDARKIFLGFKEHCRQGLIPNFLPDQAGYPAYNTVDATLWYVNAVLQYLKYTADFRFVQENLWETLKAIVENHVKGTSFNIRADSDGLLSHGPQLTWMDAAVDGQPVTPRSGKAVEVQALWYNAVRIVELLASRFKDRNEADRYGQMAEKTRRSFAQKFWNEEKNCLFDVVSEHGDDGSLRPNQILAVALDFAMLDSVRSEKVVDVVQREFVTPYGLRTLARNDPRYAGTYAGDRRSRDKAYHNGTVWPWLLGPFTTAFLKTRGRSDPTHKGEQRDFLTPLLGKQVFEAGLGSINEIFDGESPHMPRGCIAQAWSVAEPIRAYVEDFMQIKPRHEKDVLENLG